MRIQRETTDSAVLVELGSRLARLRLARNLTQLQLAAEAGVNVKAVQRLEAGEHVQLITLIRVLRGLGHVEWLDALVPAAEPSPLELVELHGRGRRRASGRRGSKPRDEEGSPWRWGDES